MADDNKIVEEVFGEKLEDLLGDGTKKSSGELLLLVARRLYKLEAESGR